MIRLNKGKRPEEQLFVNPKLIESVSLSDVGDTNIRMLSGDLLVVTESPSAVIDEIEQSVLFRSNTSRIKA